MASPIAEVGYGNTLIPPIPCRASKTTPSLSEGSGSSRPSTAPSRRPSPLSRENSYQDSSEPSSQPGIAQEIRRKPQYPEGDFRNSSGGDLVTLKADMMCSWLHHQQIEKGWSRASPGEGVMLKKARGDYMCCPKQLQTEENGLLVTASKLNVRVRAIQQLA
jgi:hypothetical protein